MEYPTFTVNFPVILFSIMVTVVVGVIALVLTSLKKRQLAVILSSATVLLITAFVIASGFLEAARTNEMLRAADDLAVPEGFKPGNVPGRTGRVVQATAFLPCLAVTAPCPSLHRQWSGPEGQGLTREDVERTIRDSGWQGKLAVNEENCELQYTNSSEITCEASGKLQDFDAQLRLDQIRGDAWRLYLTLRPERLAAHLERYQGGEPSLRGRLLWAIYERFLRTQVGASKIPLACPAPGDVVCA